MTTQSVIQRIACEVVAMRNFTPDHFWNRTHGTWELNLLPRAERALQEKLQALPDEEYTQILRECDETGISAQAFAEGSLSHQATREVVMRQLRAVAGRLCPPKGHI